MSPVNFKKCVSNNKRWIIIAESSLNRLKYMGCLSLSDSIIIMYLSSFYRCCAIMECLQLPILFDLRVN